VVSRRSSVTNPASLDRVGGGHLGGRAWRDRHGPGGGGFFGCGGGEAMGGALERGCGFGVVGCEDSGENVEDPGELGPVAAPVEVAYRPRREFECYRPVPDPGVDQRPVGDLGAALAEEENLLSASFAVDRGDVDLALELLPLRPRRVGSGTWCGSRPTRSGSTLRPSRVGPQWGCG
jgi:hypothetical protein